MSRREVGQSPDEIFAVDCSIEQSIFFGSAVTGYSACSDVPMPRTIAQAC